jgi:hypothetical protein
MITSVNASGNRNGDDADIQARLNPELKTNPPSSELGSAYERGIAGEFGVFFQTVGKSAKHV